MTTATIIAANDPSSIIDSAQRFMDYGPLGLAGLLIALVLTTVLLRNVDEARERVLKLVLFVGALCFVAALTAQHFAPPAKEAANYSKQRAVLANAEKALADASPKLREIISMASDGGGCPGGAHGIAIPHGADMASRGSGVLAALEAGRSNIHAVIESLPDGK
jgi:hypothetical protein